MSDYNDIDKEVRKKLESAKPKVPTPIQTSNQLCNFNQNGTPRWRFGAGMVFLSIFILQLNSDIPPENKWLFFLMAGILLIVGTISINISVKESKLIKNNNIG